MLYRFQKLLQSVETGYVDADSPEEAQRMLDENEVDFVIEYEDDLADEWISVPEEEWRDCKDHDDVEHWMLLEDYLDEK